MPVSDGWDAHSGAGSRLRLRKGLLGANYSERTRRCLSPGIERQTAGATEFRCKPPCLLLAGVIKQDPSL